MLKDVSALKKEFENIQVPQELDLFIEQAIRKGRRVNTTGRIFKPLVTVASIILVFALSISTTFLFISKTGLSGCVREQPVIPDPGPAIEEPIPKPKPKPEPEPRVLALEGTDIRTLELIPTSHNFRVNDQFISYYIPANIDVLYLTDIFGTDYPLPKPKDIRMPTTEGAVWRGDKLYYLSRPGIDEGPEGFFLYEYSTATHTATEHKLNFPDSFYPEESFFVTWDGEVFFVGETGTYKYTLANKTLKKVAEFNLDWQISSWSSRWHPEKPLLFYFEGNKLWCFDPQSGKSTVFYQASGAISEFCWRDSRTLTLLRGNQLEILDENGRLLNSHRICEGARSLGWVPERGMASYRVPVGSNAYQLFVEDFENEMLYTYRDCDDYIWSSVNEIWTYSEDQETGTAILVLSRINWEPGQNQKVEIPYFKSREEDPKLPLDYAQGDYEKIAAELFTLHMEDLKSQGSITDFKLLRVVFEQEEQWGFFVCIDYSVQSSDESWQSGNGELGKEGWVNNKSNFINIYRDDDYYVMGSQWSTSP